MGKIIRRVIAILLCATAVALAVLPAGTAEATSAHGDYEYDGATAAKYIGSDSEVTLPAWINRVGKEAFEGYDKMTKLVLPDSVTTVDFGAFSNCTNLGSVQMSESVRTLGSAAFSGCSSLYSVSVPKTVREIGSGAFAGCTSLGSVPVSPLNEHYTSYDGVIYSNDGKKLVQYLAGRPATTYQMPVSVREIEEYAFWGANNLSKLSISYGVDKIPEYAFSNCKGLQHVTLPRSVQSIFAYAFENCDSLSYINIPDSVGYIDDRAFANTRGAILRFVDSNGNVVKSFNSDDVSHYGSGTGGVPTVNKPDYEKNAAELNNQSANNQSDNNQAANNTAATNSSTNDQNTGNTNAADSSTTSQSSDNTSSTNSGTTDNSGDSSAQTTPGTGSSTNNQGTGTTDQGSTGGTSSSNDAGSTNANTVNSNGSTTYSDDGTAFNPENVTPLDEGDQPSGNATSTGNTNGQAGDESTQQTGQTSAPSNIIDETGLYNDGYYKASDSGSQPWNTKIEYHDFEQNMTPYDLGAGVVLGGQTVLRMSSAIPVKGFDFDNAEYEDGYGDLAANRRPVSENDVIGDVYAAYSGDASSVNVPAGIKKIGNRAFYRNGNLDSVKLPNSVDSIGEFAFARSALSDINLPDGLTDIDYAAFYNCPNLSSIGIPASVSNIALGAFDGTPFLENWKNSGDGDYLVVGDGVLLAYKGRDPKIMIPENVKHIGAGTFSHNPNLESVVIPGNVQDIGEEAFSDCSKLSELVMDEGVRNIGDRAFKNSALKVVNLPDSIEGIGLSAFDNGGTLQTVIFNGTNAPNVTYDRSATRLSAKKLRSSAFEGAENAIVSNQCDLNSGTMFDPRYYGFKGEVYSISSNDDKTLLLERSLAKPDASGVVLVNQNVNVAGQNYTLNQVKRDAFDNYRDGSEYYDNKLTKVAVNGEQSSDLVTLLDSVNADIASEIPASEDTGTASPEYTSTVESEEAASEANRPKSNITVSVNGSRFPTRGNAYANIPEDDDKYKLDITEDDSQSGAINSAFLHSTGTSPAGGYVPLSVDLYDKSGTVPIHKLGNSKMEVSVPVPSGMEDDDGLGVACLDDNGLLEPLASEVEDVDGAKNLKFVAGHCSPYVIYSRGHRSVTYDENGNPIETVEDGQAAANTFLMSGTWQSLNQKNAYGISPKWFIIFILIALAAILVLYKPSAKKNK